MDPQQMTLGEFVQQLLIQLGDQQLPFKRERPWHELFYELKTQPDSPGKPAFLKTLFFDWNGDFPKCQELSEYLYALHWTGCMTAANPGYDRFTLNADVSRLWTIELDEGLRVFVSEAADRARHELAV